MLLRAVAEEDSNVLSRSEALRDRSGAITGMHAGEARGHSDATLLTHRVHNLSQHPRQFARPHDRLVLEVDEQLVIRDMDDVDVLPPLRSLANPVSDQRMVLA